MKFAGMFVAALLIVGAGQVVSGQEQATRDQLRVAAQGICPISGKNLGSMGTPVKVKIGQETVFVCCKGCLKGQVNPQHWATIHANFAKAQRICPIMKHKLPKNAKWTIVEGQIIYVCCPPCIKKIAADPETYLRKVDELYSASLRTRRVRQ
ncbi:MAG: hypothetical protein N2C14_22045 [Planctomycetales bacterium]